MGDKKAVVKNVDMTEEMQDEAINTAIQAIAKYNIEKDISAYIKKEFDRTYGPTWYGFVWTLLIGVLLICPLFHLFRLISSDSHLRSERKSSSERSAVLTNLTLSPTFSNRHCIVGRNFGSYVTHETKHFIYFYLGQVAILLFKSG